MLFHIVLDAGVYGGHQVVAVLPGIVFLKLAEEQLRAHGVGGPHRLAWAAGEGLVILGLYPLQAVVVRAHKADDMAGQGGVGIIPLGIRLQAHAPEIVLRLEGPHLIGLVLLQLPGSGHIPAALLPGLLVYLIIAYIQYLRQPPGDELPVLPIHLYLCRAQIHIIHRGAHRQSVHVGVVYDPPHGGAGYGAQLLLYGHALIFFVVNDLKLIQTPQ